MIHICINIHHIMLAKQQRKPPEKSRSLTDSSHRPVVDELAGTEGQVLKREILQLPFPRLKAVVGKENNGSIIPKTILKIPKF